MLVSQPGLGGSVCACVDKIPSLQYDVPALEAMGGTLNDEIKLGTDEMDLLKFWKTCRPYTSDKFRLTWQNAMYYYVGGYDGSQADWRQSKVLLNKCCECSILLQTSSTIVPEGPSGRRQLAAVQSPAVEMLCVFRTLTAVLKRRTGRSFGGQTLRWHQQVVLNECSASGLGLASHECVSLSVCARACVRVCSVNASPGRVSVSDHMSLACV